MSQLRRSITLDFYTDEWVRSNIKNFSKFVRDAIEDEKILQETNMFDESDVSSVASSPAPFGTRLRMFERYRKISQRISSRWKEEESPYRCGIQGRWRKWTHERGGMVDADLIPCMDHIGFYRDGDQICATIEPYGYSMHCAKLLIEYCEERGLEFFIDAESSHAPGACIRILIREKKNIVGL